MIWKKIMDLKGKLVVIIILEFYGWDENVKYVCKFITIDIERAK